MAVVLAGDVVARESWLRWAGVKRAMPRPIVGAGKVARLLATGWYRSGIERSVEPVQVNGGPGLLVRVAGGIDGVLAVRVESGHVTGLYHVRNPAKLSRVERETTVSR